MAPGKKTSKRKRWLIVAIAAVVVVAGAGAWFLTRPAPAQSMRMRAFTAQAARADQTQTVSLSGTLAPKKQASLNFSVAGEVNKVYVKVGDQVAKGAKLARVGSADLSNAVELAEANLKSAKASYTEASSSSTAAKNAAKARVDSAQAALDNAEEDLDNAVLRSTIAGTVAQLGVEVGDQVSGSGGASAQSSGYSSQDSSGSAQVLVISTATWKLEGTISSADLSQVKIGQAAQISLDAGQEPIEGKVTEVGIVATSSSDGSATFPVTVELSGKHPELYSGTSADAAITVAEASDVLTVPTAAITNTDGKTQVILSVDGEQSPREVTIGRVFGDNTEILEGLDAGDEVVVSAFFGEASGDGEGGITFGGGGVFGGGIGGAPPNMGSGGGAPPNGGTRPGR
ncbi:MAG: HlyD family efflux transporter periplasmic adaptor subunit [Propionibacteriaceae bacterium]|jgi:macrolide-specific efflux system membrane fusion protein|nr:HlyD family efflux transporter periplasmic adaptor subunit [Propionibacteriaceae bacterium]